VEGELPVLVPRRVGLEVDAHGVAVSHILSPRATGLSENDPERLGPLRAEILPAVRRAAVEQRAVTGLEQVTVAVIVQGDLAVDQGADRHAERRRDPAERMERRREPPRLDLRHHARREVRLLRELALLQLALGAQALDAPAERGHATSAAGSPAGASPARDASARATNTRVIFFR